MIFEIITADSFERRTNEVRSFPQLEIWNNLTAEIPIVTEIRQTTSGFWLACKGVGAIEIVCNNLQIIAYPAQDVVANKFNYYLIHYWLPLAYQVCGTQVIHASAVVHRESRKLILICGESGSGKSTLAFGLAQRDSWQQIADDRIAFSIDEGKVILQHIPDAVKLRPASADFFDEVPYEFTKIDWYEEHNNLDLVLFPNQKTAEKVPKIHPISKADAFTFLMNQAFAIAPSLKEQNTQMILHYLALADQTRAFKLFYSKKFRQFEKVLDAIEEIAE